MSSETVDTAWVRLWGRTVGAVAWDRTRELGSFEFERDFLREGLDLAPLTMPLSQALAGRRTWRFPALPRETYFGLPGLLADALPDAFGHRLIDAWLLRQGRTPASFSPVERLCYTGRRGMGALEFEPVLLGTFDESVPVEIGELVTLAQSVLDERQALHGEFGPTGTGDPTRVETGKRRAGTLMDILRVGTSAGGGRPKAVIAWNESSGEVRSGQVDAPEGFTHWILKFDGVHDGSLGDPAGYGRIEYAYHLMARAAGIEMSACRLLEEDGRAHFLTRRFDRGPRNEKIHLQSLCALAHLDYQQPGAHSYEEAFAVLRALGLPHPQVEELFRRMVFNVVARNQDDHTKNFAFLMGADGRWRLSPAYDLTYAYNPQGRWTARHQMSVRGKRADIEREDLLAVGRENTIKKAEEIIDAVVEAVRRWPEFAAEAKVESARVEAIGKAHRLL